MEQRATLNMETNFYRYGNHFILKPVHETHNP